jgi:hypothetical protein
MPQVYTRTRDTSAQGAEPCVKAEAPDCDDTGQVPDCAGVMFRPLNVR